MAASGGVSLLVFLTTAAAVIAPWFYFAIHKAPGRGLTSTRSLLNIFVLLHSLYLLYQLIVLPPTNIFARLRIPVSTPADAIRAVLLAQSDTGDLPPPLETLLKRLGSFDVKTYYIRFGHAVVTTCDYCLAFDDFGLFAVPRALLSYICAAAAIGVITIASSGHERYRTLAVAAVAGAFCVEAYYIATATIQIPKDDAPVFMWHDTLLLARRLLFLLLPVALHLLPSSSPLSPASAPALALRAAEHTTARLQLLRLARGAVLRDPGLRARAAAWWEAEAAEGAWVRGDAGVRALARRLGSGFDEAGEDGGEGRDGEGEGGGVEGGKEGPLRTSARNGVSALKMGFAPSEYWRVPPP